MRGGGVWKCLVSRRCILVRRIVRRGFEDVFGQKGYGWRVQNFRLYPKYRQFVVPP